MYSIFAKLLEQNGIKTSQVARETGISNMTFSDWKNGKSVPKADKLQKIADYFNVSVDYLISGSEPLSPSMQGTLLAEFSFEHMDMLQKFMFLPDEKKKEFKEILNIYCELSPILQNYLLKTCRNLQELQSNYDNKN